MICIDFCVNDEVIGIACGEFDHQVVQGNIRGQFRLEEIILLLLGKYGLLLHHSAPFFARFEPLLIVISSIKVFGNGP